MNRTIRKVVVLGAGVMGSGIAAHMANAGLDVYLLDMVPEEPDRQSPAFRNKFAQMGVEKALKAEPPAFYVPENAKLITIGNLEDNLAYLRDADWVIEAVVEDIEIKRQLLQKIGPFLRPGTIVSTNTSGISVNKLAEALGKQHREFFLSTHFSNPPRYMKLMEIVSANSTSREVMRFIADFCERQLGKGIVLAKDTPDFIANRVGIHNVIATIKIMLAEGYTLEEVDAITGLPLGRPRSATFRTLDIVGLDTLARICRNVSENVTDAMEKTDFVPPEFMVRMVQQGFTGDKRGQGFYRRVKTAEGKRVDSFDHNTFQYVPMRKVELPGLDALKGIEDSGKRIKALVYADDRAGRFAWAVTKKLLLYAASKVSEIADDIVSVDRAIRWGFNHEFGPFEVWDAISVRESVAKMTAEGECIPENVAQMLSRNQDRFYLRRDGKPYYYDFRAQDYREIEEKPKVILLPSLKDRKRLVRSNASASLIDIGEGVACLEFHSPHNAIDTDILDMIDFSIDEVASNWEGLVIGNQGKNFCVGTNLGLVLREAQNLNWNRLDAMVRQMQDACRKIKFSQRPVVAAPFRNTLSAGCEFCLAASRMRASAETYIGLPEVGVGLVPAGGGCKEMLIRSMDGIPATVPGVMQSVNQPNLVPFVGRVFETTASGKVSTSAGDAQKIGYLSAQDRITFNEDYLLHDARETVICLVKEGYQPRRPRDDIRVTGRTGLAVMEATIYYLKEGAYITEYDAHIAKKLATILAAGNLPQNALVTEDYLFDLEREAFLSLCGEVKTQARMRAMLQTGRPLRN